MSFVSFTSRSLTLYFFFVHRTRSRRRSAYQRSWHSAHFCRILKEKLGRPCYCIVNRWRCCRIFIFCPHSVHSSKCWLLWLKVPTDGTVVDPPSPSSICCVEWIMKFCDLDPFRVTNSFIWFDYREHKFYKLNLIDRRWWFKSFKLL